MRFLRALLLPLALAACGHGTPPPADEPGAIVIGCALAAGAPLAPGCTLERSGPPGARLLLLRHPDGGFRRLHVAADGSIAAADGAEPAMVRAIGPNELEVSVSDERYRLPASPGEGP